MAEPLPVPLAPEEMVIQLLLLTAVQLHPACVVTLTTPETCPEPTLLLSGEMVNVQLVATPACVTVKVCPPIVTVPIRELELALALTE